MIQAVRREPAFRAALAASLMAAGCCLTSAARAQTSYIMDDGYHSQTAAMGCAIASMEMELDTSAITGYTGGGVLNGAATGTNTNPFVTLLLQLGDGAYTTMNYPSLVGQSAQAYIYDLVHFSPYYQPTLANYNKAINNNLGASALNNTTAYTYYNPYISNLGFGTGTDLNSLQFGLNVLDNSSKAGLGVVAPNHAYASYNLASGYYASRTIATALFATNIPAVITIGHGQHAISVFGVNTTGAPALNTNYTINGFFVHDPWTGYTANVPAAARNGRGLGYNTYLRYGYDKPIPGAEDLTLPGGGMATVNRTTWFGNFNVAGGQPAASPSAAYQTGAGYKFEVEPQGPTLPDTGGPNGSYYSLPTLTPELPSQLTGSGADTDIAPDLASDGLTSDFSGGSFDTADQSLITDPADPSLQGDWVIPYDGGGGVNDVTGAVLIDEDTGVIDQATWIDASDPQQSMTLSQIDQMYFDQMNDIEPNDDAVPEPGAYAQVVCLSSMALLYRRRVRQTR